MSMSISADDCMKYAAECVEMAEDPKLSAQRDRLLTLAQMWRELAEEKMAARVN
jgi:hypothetical protein